MSPDARRKNKTKQNYYYYKHKIFPRDEDDDRGGGGGEESFVSRDKSSCLNSKTVSIYNLRILRKRIARSVFHIKSMDDVLLCTHARVCDGGDGRV